MRTMHRWFFAVLLALPLTACATEGPGKACTPCEQVPAVADATGPFASAAAAAAKGGQDASNQPQQQDPARINPNVLASSGAGAATWTKQDTESRSQAGAPSVNQSVITPTTADAKAGGGLSPVVAGLQVYIDRLTALLEAEMARPIGERDPQVVSRYQDQIASAFQTMAQAQASAIGSVTHNNHFEGAVITLTVANGSASGDGTQAVNPENAKALAAGVEGALNGAAAVKAAGPAESPSQPGPSPAPPPAEEPK